MRQLVPVLFGGLLFGCQRAGPTAEPGAAPPGAVADTEADGLQSAPARGDAREPSRAPDAGALVSPPAAKTAARDAASGSRSAESSSADAPPLPDGVVPGRRVVVPVRGDRPVHVIHAPRGVHRALVYLHGVCGDITAPDAWAGAVSRSATLVALVGDERCPGSDRYRWRRDVGKIQRRIDRALEVVRAARGGQLETSRLALFGYSQGAHRAERLVEQYPDRYPWLVLGGVPTEPSASALGRARAVAVLGGARENTDPVKGWVTDLQRAGIDARFFVLPGARHGQYGSEAESVLDAVFRFVFGASSGDATSVPSGTPA